MAKFVCSALRRYFPSKSNISSFPFFMLEHTNIRYLYTTHRSAQKLCLHPQACTYSCDRNLSTNANTSEDCDSKNPSQTNSEFALEIMRIVSKVDKMVLSLQLHTVQRQINALLTAGLTNSEVHELLTASPVLLRETKLQQFVQFLQSYGFQNSEIISLLQKEHRIIETGQGKIESVFETLQANGQSSDQITSLLANNPKIFTMTTKQLLGRLDALKALFKTQDVFTLILKSPSVLYGDWEIFLEKFMYVFQTMKITQPQMMKSHVFDHHLNHIKSRHSFLTRSGQWFTGKLKGGEKSPNPRLSEIVDSTDEYFTRKFGNMSGGEYRTFCKLLAKEDKQYEE